MNLLEMIERINLDILNAESEENNNNNVNQDISPYKKKNSKASLETFLSRYQNKVDAKTITQEDICDISSHIVQSQYFKDGNHRTAVLAYYELHIDCLHMAPRLKTYQAYAAIDYEYGQGQISIANSNNNNDIDTTMSNNALFLATNTRGKIKLESSKLREKYKGIFRENIRNLPGELDALSKVHDYIGENAHTNRFKNNIKINPSERARHRFFCLYAGNIPRMGHSTDFDSSDYDESYQKAMTRLP